MRRAFMVVALLVALTAARTGVVRETTAQGVGPVQDRVVAAERAAEFAGQTTTVEGVVNDVGVSRRSGTVFLDFGAPYPRHVFTAVIFRSAAGRFPNPDQWKGQRVRVTGTVRMYRGKPEIILIDPAQLRRAE